MYGIIQNTKVILEKFPFTDVLNHSRKFWKLEFNDSKIKDLELKARNRFAHKIIRNQNYLKLLQWMDEFRELNILIQRVSADTKSKSLLESPKDIDTIYEAWIFLEFIHYLHEKHILISTLAHSENLDKKNRVYKLNIYNGNIIPVVESPAINSRILTDEQGNLAMAIATDSDENKVVYRYIAKTNSWQKSQTSGERTRCFSIPNNSFSSPLFCNLFRVSSINCNATIRLIEILFCNSLNVFGRY